MNRCFVSISSMLYKVSYRRVIYILTIWTLGNKGKIKIERVQMIKGNDKRRVVVELTKEKGNNCGIKELSREFIRVLFRIE